MQEAEPRKNLIFQVICVVFFRVLDAFTIQLQPAVIADNGAINAQSFFGSDPRCFMKTWNRPLVTNMTRTLPKWVAEHYLEIPWEQQRE